MNKRILLADDDESVRKMVARVLESAGYQVLQASTGREAVAKFRSANPNLVLLDLKMPDQVGWQTFQEISRHDSRVPVIAITAWPNQYEEAAQRGIDALMEKPLDMSALLQTIQNFLQEPETERIRRITDRSFTPFYFRQSPSLA